MPGPIIVVDSSPAVRRLVEQISTPEGFDVVGFQDGPSALEAAKHSSPALIIADYNLDNMTFSGFCKEINKLTHLTDTYIVSLINSADHPDEGHLRSLGVKAFLNKPFQSDELLGIIKTLHQKQQTPTAAGFKRRSWPPSADDEDDTPNHVITGLAGPQAKPIEPPNIFIAPTPTPIPEPTPTLSVPVMNQATPGPQEAMTGLQSPQAKPIETPNIFIAPTPVPASPPEPTSPVSAPITNQAATGPQDAMKGLFDQLLLSVSKETEKRLTDILPRAIEERLLNQVRPFVQQEVRAQLGAVLSAEQLSAIIHPLLSQELPSLLGKEIAKYEALIRQATSEAAGSLAAEKVDQWVREQAESSIRKQLTDTIREHIGTVDQTVKDEVRAAVAQQVPKLTDEFIRSTAEQSVEQSVRRIVPELAEQHIQAELKRLTAPD